MISMTILDYKNSLCSSRNYGRGSAHSQYQDSTTGSLFTHRQSCHERDGDLHFSLSDKVEFMKLAMQGWLCHLKA